jgi:hypothetical protein
MPIVFMNEITMPGIGEHVFWSQSLWGEPARLHRTFLAKGMNRNIAYAKCAAHFMEVAVSTPGSSCDEYPFASTLEGPIGTVAFVPLPSQWVQGGVLSVFYTACLIPPDVPVLNEFLVLPVMSAPSAFQCRYFGSN